MKEVRKAHTVGKVSVCLAGAGALAIGLLAASPAAAKNVEPFAVQNSTTASVAPGSTMWLSTTFVGVCETASFSETLKAPKGYVVTYPAAPRDGTDTSLYFDDSLKPNEIDVANFQLTVPADAKPGSSAKLTVEVSYLVDEACRKGDKGEKGEKVEMKKHKTKFNLEVPIS
jgi:hypothetical protein